MNQYSEFTYPTTLDMNSMNGTLRGISTLPQDIIKVVSVPSPQIYATERPKPPGRKRVDRAISNFHIEFDNGEKYQPGSDMTGRVIMDVWSPIDIRYVEFVIQGKTTIRQFKEQGGSSSFTQRPKNEIHLDKKILLLSPKDGQASLILTPGKYVSSFVYKIPSGVPPTVEQVDIGNGYVFNVSYTVQANICDHLQHTKSSSSQREKYAQVIKSTKRMVNVAPELDYQNLPGALDPITHAEQFNMTLFWMNSDPTSTLVKLNHQVYAVGDVIGLHLEIYTPNPQRIGKITADFEQKILIKGDSPKKLNRIIVRALDDPHERKYRLKGSIGETLRKVKNMYKTGFKIPVPKTMIPSLMPISKMMSVSYVMHVVINFKRLGGKIQMKIPVTIAPAMDPGMIKTQQTTSIPLFNKPIMQFPYFAKKNLLRDSNHSIKSASPSTVSDESFRRFSSNKKESKKQRKHEKVRVTHKNCLGF